MEALNQAEPVQVTEVEGADNHVVSNVKVETPPEGVMPSPDQEVQPIEDPTQVEESLEELKEEYDDAKLNNIIIEQVKELIEIDNNLNTKIDDVRADLKKEIEERERLNKKIDSHYDELRDLDKSIEKFIALYEVVTNQFNPFVKQGDTDTQDRMKELLEGMKPQQKSVQPEQHFVTKTGKSVSNIPELIAMLKEMDELDYVHHVTPHKNDFAVWVHDALKDPELANKISSLRNRVDMIKALEESVQ